ncbi:MAG: N-acetylmuramic acid 6-phosphate etherase, partial [Candidatus Paceibacteria bacterium]
MSSAEDVPDRSGLTTEALNKATVELDALPTVQALALIGREDRCIHDAIAGAQQSIANAIDAIAERLARGGRLLYVGAGTSGRLGVLDAVECPPTFQCAPDQVQGILAGGKGAMFQSVEGAEDSGAEAAKELEALGLNENDVVFGITAGGTTPFVHGAIASGQRAGALTVFFAC